MRNEDGESVILHSLPGRWIWHGLFLRDRHLAIGTSFWSPEHAEQPLIGGDEADFVFCGHAK